MAASLSDDIKEARAREAVARIDAEIARVKEEGRAEVARLKTERRKARKYVDWFIKRRAAARYWRRKHEKDAS